MLPIAVAEGEEALDILLSLAIFSMSKPWSYLSEYSLRRVWDNQADAAYDRGMKSVISTTVGQMTKDELREMIEESIEQKLLELLGDPDEGLEIRKSVRDRLLRQKQAVAQGERGEAFEDVVQRLGLK